MIPGFLKKCVFAAILFSLISGLSFSRISAQDTDFTAEAQALLNAMTPEQRVGQLFLVTFLGDDTSYESNIADLIVNYHVGGIALQSENDNISAGENAAIQVANLVNNLQSLALLGLPEEQTVGEQEVLPLITPTPSTTPAANRIPVPLFIATMHEGDGPPYSDIHQGLTELPNLMAIGATWQPELSEAIGMIAGRELAGIGVNFLLGPSLDVLESPQPLSEGDLGTRAFGGDPYWVGLMGKAYTTGIHLGSEGRVAVIANHFPGYGSSDRPINEEVGTVRKSLEQLKQIELAPFFAVTGDAEDPLSRVDGLLTAHVRYQGFQGNIRATTAPVSFDPQALNTLLELPQFSTWRQQGGLVVSDELGVRAVQRFYDDTGKEFPHRLIAKDALLAGNDVLYLSDFALAGEDYEGQLANIKDTINWFVERYESDPTFQQRIDEATLRILQLKLHTYGGEFDPENVLVDTATLPELLIQGQASIFNLAQQSATLIAPGPVELDELLPIGVQDRVVIFTDVRESSQCSTCPPQPWLDQNALEQRMLALYGPQASAQVQPGQLSSFSFEQLKDFLLGRPSAIPTPTTPLTPTREVGLFTPTPLPGLPSTLQPTPTISASGRVQSALENADWVLFAMLRPEPSAEASDAIHLFLRQRTDIVRNANVIVFAFNAPYFLDTTEISSLSAYIGLYSKIDAFVDAAVRALYKESPLRGRPPVNIEGIRYDLFEATKPDPTQIIELYIVDDGALKSPPSQEPLEVVPGATLRLQTGIIVDHNGNPVPDGTPVQFIQQDRIQGFVNVIGEQPTVNGIANLDYLLEARTGNFRITAAAEQARSSQEVDIVIGENAIVSVNTPTPAPTLTVTPTETPTVTSTPTDTPEPTPTLTPEPTATTEPPNPEPEDGTSNIISQGQLLVGFGLGLLVTGGAGYAIGRNERRETIALVRCVLWGLVGGLVAYNYFILGLPGTEWLQPLGAWAALLSTLFGGAAALFLYRLSQRLG